MVLWLLQFRRGSIESIGAGKKFAIGSKFPVEMRIRHGERELIAIRRIKWVPPKLCDALSPACQYFEAASGLDRC
jgi:hypothetical protein